MRRLAVLAVLVIAVGGWYVTRSVGHIPLFSANLERLAETPTEGYCAGVGFWQARGRQPQAAELAAVCREEHPATPIDLQRVQKRFCEAIVESGYEQGVGSCLAIVTGNRYWPTYDGGLTSAWSRNYPYPGDLILQEAPPPDESRTGIRDGNQRED